MTVDNHPLPSGRNGFRIGLCALGAVAGFALWVLGVEGPDILGETALYLFLVAFAASFAFVSMVTAGGLGFRKASGLAAAISLISAGLFSTASVRFDDIYAFAGQGFPITAFVLLTCIPLPFLIAYLRSDLGETWQNYPALFTHSWNIVVRSGAGFIFAGLSWVLIILSDLLLGLVGFSVFAVITGVGPLPALLTGGFLGLGLAVADEYPDIISPYLVLRLLRLFMPVTFLVLVVFMIGLLFGGPSTGFFRLSDVEILLIMVALGVSLISASIDQSDVLGIQTLWMQRAARALAVLLPVLCCVALYLIAGRVMGRGWVPETVVQAIWSLIGTVYALAYVASVLRSNNWRARLRWINVRLALIFIFILALSLSPFLNPQKVATDSQVARFTSGKTTADELPLWEMTHAWGRAGRVGVEQLTQLDTHPQGIRLAELVTLAQDRRTAGQYRHAKTTPDLDVLRGDFLKVLEVRPREATVPDGLLAQISSYNLASWTRNCGNTSDALSAGCVLILADLVPAKMGPEGLFLYTTDGTTVWSELFIRDNEMAYKTVNVLTVPEFFSAQFSIDDLQAALAGDYSIAPAELNILRLNGRDLSPAD
jgi:hypothetical protein